MISKVWDEIEVLNLHHSAIYWPELPLERSRRMHGEPRWNGGDERALQPLPEAFESQT